MRYTNNQTIEEWADRVRIYEFGLALQQIASGQPCDVVMESMSIRIQQKIMHPIIQLIKTSKVSNYDADRSLENYKKNYLERSAPVADHMNDVD